jgi:hypothetical protein
MRMFGCDYACGARAPHSRYVRICRRLAVHARTHKAHRPRVVSRQPYCIDERPCDRPYAVARRGSSKVLTHSRLADCCGSRFCRHLSFAHPEEGQRVVSCRESRKKKELLEHLRRTRGMRRSHHYTQKTAIHGKIVAAVSVSARPASAEDRAVPGHWEGDMFLGSGNSQIATLVERQTRYVMLVKATGKQREHERAAQAVSAERNRHLGLFTASAQRDRETIEPEAAEDTWLPNTR